MNKITVNGNHVSRLMQHMIQERGMHGLVWSETPNLSK
jgi:hypothetical protein